MKNLITGIIITIVGAHATWAMAGSDPVAATFVLNELEYRFENGEDPLAWSAEMSLGTRTRQLWLVSEGGSNHGVLGEHELRAYYSHALGRESALIAGWRGDLKPEPDRDWALLGLETLGPWEIEATLTAFAGQHGRSALRLELARGFEFGRAWLLVPELKANWHGHNDPEQGAGSGLSTVELGARLAYTMTPSLAPYIGVIWERPFGTTADLAEADGEGGSNSQFLVGFSLQF